MSRNRRRSGAARGAKPGDCYADHEFQSSSPSRRTASLNGFFDLSHVFVRYGESSRFETMPSRPSRQACSNTAGPSWARCSLNWIAFPARASTLARRCLRSTKFQIPQIVVLQFDQVERDQRDVMIAATAAGAPGASRSSNRVAMPFAAVHESEDRTFRT
jgi:hypothetical protein